MQAGERYRAVDVYLCVRCGVSGIRNRGGLKSGGAVQTGLVTVG